MKDKNRLRNLALILVLLAVVVVAGLALFRSGDDLPATSADLARNTRSSLSLEPPAPSGTAS